MAAGYLNGQTIILTADTTVLTTVANVTNNGGLFEVQTTAPTSLTTGNPVLISGVTGDGQITNANGSFTVTVIDSTHFTLNGIAYAGSYVSGGTVSTGPTTLTLNCSTNALSTTTLLAAITTTWPTITGSFGTGYYGANTILNLTGTTLGTTGSIVIGPGTAHSVLGLASYSTFYGSAGVDTVGQTPTALHLTNFSTPGNNGTFNVHSWIDSATVTILNPSGAAPDAGTHAHFQTGAYNNIFSGPLYGPALSGTGATITSFATPLATVSGLTGMTPAIVGQSITFSGFTHSTNNGVFVVAGYLSSSSITIENINAVSTDSGGVWGVPAGTLDGKTIILTVNGVGPTTLTLNGSTNVASMSAFFSAIEAQWPTLTAAANPNQGSLMLTENSLSGPSSSIVVGAGTANYYLGLYGSYAGLYGTKPMRSFGNRLSANAADTSRVIGIGHKRPSASRIWSQTDA